MLISLSRALEFVVTGGFTTFLPKILANQFGVTGFESSIVTGWFITGIQLLHAAVKTYIITDDNTVNTNYGAWGKEISYRFVTRKAYLQGC